MSAFEREHRELLRAGRRERAPLALRQRILGASTPAIVALPSKSLGRKSLLGGVIVVGIAILFFHFGTRHREVEHVTSLAPEPIELAPTVAEPSITSHVSSPATVTSDVPAMPVLAVPLSSAVVEPRHLDRATPIASAPLAIAEISDDDSLGAEARLLGTAKRALSLGDAVAAEAALATYDQTFPLGVLSQEAQALHIEADVRAGRRARAESALETFAGAHPRSPATARLRRMLDESNSPNPRDAAND